MIRRVGSADSSTFELEWLDGHERFSLILGNDRKKGAKAARILCEVDEVAIHVRGVEVAEEQRGRGLAKLALGTLAALGVLVDADVRARPQTKPVVDYYSKQGLYAPIDANQKADTVKAAIAKIVAGC